MIPAEVRRLKQPAHPRSSTVQIPANVQTLAGFSLAERMEALDSFPPHVILRYCENRLHDVVGPFLSLELAREWATLNAPPPITGYRLLPVSPVRPLLPALVPWSR